jgi:hypothetical protein
MTPSQPEINQEPPAVRKPFNFWNSPSRTVEPFYIASPSPPTDMRTEDFVMLRRKRGNFMDDEDADILEHLDPPVTKGKAKSKETAASKKDPPEIRESAKNKGKKWVRFLDVGISCLSDESDDELAFCKPSWTKRLGNKA